MTWETQRTWYNVDSDNHPSFDNHPISDNHPNCDNHPNWQLPDSDTRSNLAYMVITSTLTRKTQHIQYDLNSDNELDCDRLTA